MDARGPRDPSEYNIRAIERALQILECFDDEHPTRGVTEIADATGLHKATAFRIITTLANHGYLERVAGGQEYRLGMQLAALGFQTIRRLDLRREALPYMTELAKLCDETCDLSVFDHGEALCIEVVRSRHVLAPASAVGLHLPAHATASGKLFLAFLARDELDALLSQPLAAYTPNTITSPNQLRADLALIRQRGYGLDEEEYEVGVRSVSAPIRNSSGEMVAALGMPGPVGRVGRERADEIAAFLVDRAEAISRRLGWMP
ncbi:MAG: IclR family transcriptional regulator [Anaerolineae bacterium]